MNEYVIGGLGIDVNVASFITNDLHLTVLCDSDTWQLMNHSAMLCHLAFVHHYHCASQAFYTNVIRSAIAPMETACGRPQPGSTRSAMTWAFQQLRRCSWGRIDLSNRTFLACVWQCNALQVRFRAWRALNSLILTYLLTYFQGRQ